ncbi:S8/S53 family peptidase [bacterium]|nr:S8/S53 family peptidase [bacterium]
MDSADNTAAADTTPIYACAEIRGDRTAIEQQFPWTSQSASAVRQSAPEPMSLARKLARIEAAYPDSARQTGAVREAGTWRPGHLAVIYYDNLELSNVNAQRDMIRKAGATAVICSEGFEVDVAAVAPLRIDASLASQSPAPESVQPNSEYLSSTTNKALSRFLAAQYNMTLVRETYHGSFNMAHFELAPGVDEKQLAVRIQQENNDFVYYISPDMNYVLFENEPRQWDPLLDYQPLTGSGIFDSGNRREFWDDGRDTAGAEGYAYFQMNQHALQSSFLGVRPMTTPNPDFCNRPRACVLDTGVYPSHVELPYEGGGIQVGQSSYFGPDEEWPALILPPGIWDFSLPLAEQPQLYDSFGHGTGVAGCVVARGRNGEGVSGTAPYGVVYPYKINTMDVDAEGLPVPDIRLEYVHDAILAAFDNRIETGAFVANCSFGYFTPTFEEDLDPYWDEILDYIVTDPRFVLVVSAGNIQVLGLPMWEAFRVYPACLAGVTVHAGANQVISVGAVNREDERSIFSCSIWEDMPESDWIDESRAVTVTAPGGNGDPTGIYTTNDPGTPRPDIFGSGLYATASGTSYASPYVAGMVATIQAYTAALGGQTLLTGGQIKDYLFQFSRDYYWIGLELEDGEELEPLPDFTPTGGHWFPACQKPIVDASTLFSWCDIYNPRNGQTIDRAIDLTMLSHLAGGIIGDDTRLATTQYWIKDLTNNQTYTIGGSITRPEFAVEFDPYVMSAVHEGPAEISGQMFVSERGAYITDAVPVTIDRHTGEVTLLYEQSPVTAYQPIYLRSNAASTGTIDRVSYEFVYNGTYMPIGESTEGPDYKCIFDPHDGPWAEYDIGYITASLWIEESPNVPIDIDFFIIYLEDRYDWMIDVIDDTTFFRSDPVGSNCWVLAHDSLAIGEDASGRLQLAWVVFDPASGSTEPVLRFAVESGSGTWSFDVHDVEILPAWSDPDSITGFSKFSMGILDGQAGLLYRRDHGPWGPEHESDNCFVYPIGGGVPFQGFETLDGRSAHYISQRADSDSNKWYQLSESGNFLAVQIAPGVWEGDTLSGFEQDERCNSWKVLNSQHRVSTCMVQSPDCFLYRYGVIDPDSYSATLFDLPCLIDGMPVFLRLGALIPEPCQFDPQFTPVIMGTVVDTTWSSERELSIFGALLLEGAEFAFTPIEECTLTAGYDVDMHANYHDEEYFQCYPESQVITAYYSTVNDPVHIEDFGDLKVAYQTPLGWELYELDNFPSASDQHTNTWRPGGVDLYIRGDYLCALYRRRTASGGCETVLARQQLIH